MSAPWIAAGPPLTPDAATRWAPGGASAGTVIGGIRVNDGTGTGWVPYPAYINNGTSWVLVQAYVNLGSGWVLTS